jgi:TonB family protein
MCSKASHRLLCLAMLAMGAATPAWAQLEPQPTDFSDDEKPKPKAPPKLTKPPELLEAFEPEYPQAARDEGRQGDVVMLIAIDAEGLVSRIDIVASAGADLDYAAMGAASNFVFSPAEFDNKPAAVAIEYRQQFAFETIIEEVATEAAELPPETEGKSEEVLLPVNFAGVVREAGSKTDVEGAEVSVEIELPRPADLPEDEPTPLDIQTTFTDEEGRFTFRGIPAGQHRVAFALDGYEPSFTVEDFTEKERTDVVIYLQPLVTNPFETVIRERRAKKEVSRIALSREEVKKIPGTFGDPLRVIENLPGMARAPFIGGALIVRGANPADTGVYYDGVIIPILYHFGGLKSVVNAEFLEDISFYPGGFGAYYGRATAGIVDVRSRDLKMKNFRGTVDVSVIDTSFFFGGPVEIEGLPKITVAAAARRSYIDALIPIALDVFVPQSSGVVAAPVYWDYQLKMQSDLRPGQQVSVFAFGSYDDLKVIGGDGDQSFNLGFTQTFHRLVGRWTSRFPAGITHFVQPYIGLNSTDAGIESSVGLGLDFGVNTYNWGLRDELRFRPSDLLEVAVGADYFGQTYGVDIDIPLPLEIGSFPRVYPRLTGLENQRIQSSGIIHSLGLYSEAIFKPFAALQIVPGVRAEVIRFQLDPQQALDGAVTTEGGHTDLWHVDPRITARLTLFPGTTVKGAAGVYRQPPPGENLFPNSGNPNLIEPRALQFIAGLEQELIGDLNIDMQVYYIWRDLQIQDTDELVPKGNGVFDPVFYDNNGYGRTYGAELLLRHEIGRYSLAGLRDFYRNVMPSAYFSWMDPFFTEIGAFGWIAYTLSRSEIDLNENREDFILTQYDQTHILTIVGQLNVPFGFTLGGRFRYVSGNPSTKPNGSVHDLDTTDFNTLPQPTRASRLPAFQQLDLRIDRKFVFDNFSLTPYLDLLNATNRKNAESYQNDYRARRREPIPSLPILPNFGLQGEF